MSVQRARAFAKSFSNSLLLQLIQAKLYLGTGGSDRCAMAGSDELSP